MENKPLCSVVMSVYNGEEYLKEAIDSILHQSYANFEFIIIDDASTDGSLEIIQSYNDPRIIILQNNENLFLAASLNKGIKSAKGKYLVRMDADDISMPERLWKQVNYMEENPSIGISGTCTEVFGYKPSHGKFNTHNHIIKYKLLHECHFLHPSLIIRKDLITKHNLFYDENFRKNQDYELYSRAIKFTQFGNLPDYLLKYRQTKENIKRESHNQKENILAIQKKLFLNIGYKISDKEIELYKSINYQSYTQTSNYVAESYSLLNNIIASNRKTFFFNSNDFEPYIYGLFENVCRNSKGSGFTPFKYYLKFNPSQNYFRKVKIILILFVKNSLDFFLFQKNNNANFN